MKSVRKWSWTVAYLVLVTIAWTGPRAVDAKPQSFSEDEEINEDLIANIKNIEIKCSSTEITIKIPTPHPEFNGMVYPQGLSKNSSCLREYESSTEEFIEYTLPLRSCNTMTTSSESEEEYFNTIVLEPHPKLVTGHGRGFHVRCKYRRQDKANMPSVTMKILKNGEEIRHQGNESISIGDPLQFQIILHSNVTIPFIVTDCHVRDGLGWAEELLVNSFGCPVDSEILPPFTYEPNKASVEFAAHKFPYSPTVYYSCSVKVCKRSGGGADDPKNEGTSCLTPVCQGSKNLREASFSKFKRDASNSDEPATVQVYNGLWVNENPEAEAEADKAADVLREKQARGEVLCFKQRDFALAIAISGLILMVAVILLLFILCLRRRRAFKSSSETGSSSIYSGSGTNFTGNTKGGYTNTAYSHSSD